MNRYFLTERTSVLELITLIIGAIINLSFAIWHFDNIIKEK